MCELIRDYICKHCAGDLYIEKKIDKTNQLNSSYKAIIYCKSCASHIEIYSYSEKDYNNNIKDVLGLISIKNKSNTSINKIPTFYNQYQYMNYQEVIELLNELLSKGNFIDQYGDIDDSSLYEEAVDKAMKAIKQQIKQKVIYENHNSFNSCYCPVCKRFVGLDEVSKYTHNYCDYCGQALDWSVTQ